jgi:hypothetical protein
MIVEDPHAYNDNRYRAQLVLIYLLVAETGERLGAIVRSESYRKEEVALCYRVQSPTPYVLRSQTDVSF